MGEGDRGRATFDLGLVVVERSGADPGLVGDSVSGISLTSNISTSSEILSNILKIIFKKYLRGGSKGGSEEGTG